MFEKKKVQIVCVTEVPLSCQSYLVRQDPYPIILLLVVQSQRAVVDGRLTHDDDQHHDINQVLPKLCD